MAAPARRRDGRPVETVPEAPQPAPPPERTDAHGLTAAVMGGAAVGAAGGTVVVATLPAGQAVALSAAAILGAFERFLDARHHDVADRAVASVGDGKLTAEDVDEVTRTEIAAERAYRAKVRVRLDRDLPVALAIADPDTRRDAVRRILERERRIAAQREQAISVRALGAAEARIVKRESPQGAYWKLSPFVAEHTADCLGMAEKVWPWTVLDGFRPPLHLGCGCQLVPIDEARRRNLPGAWSESSPEEAFRWMQVQETPWPDRDEPRLPGPSIPSRWREEPNASLAADAPEPEAPTEPAEGDEADPPVATPAAPSADPAAPSDDRAQREPDTEA